jgi:lysozyme family protein
MRSVGITKILASAILALGVTGGAIATAAPGFAAPAPVGASSPASTVTPLAVVNLGLSTQQAKDVQCWLRDFWQYTDSIDGQLGPNSWKAFQRNLKEFWGYTGAIDGVVGGGTVSALQRLLKNGGWGYTGPIDGKAGSGTQAAFKNFANGHSC